MMTGQLIRANVSALVTAIRKLSPMITPNKELRKLLKEVQSAGLLVNKSGKHIKIKNPETGQQVSIPATPGGGTRTWLNIVLEIKKGVGYDARRV
jgi:hypothetical protein